MKRDPKKSVVIPSVDQYSPYKKIDVLVVQTVPDRVVVLEDMLKVAWVEVGRLKKKQETGKALESNEVRTLTGLMDAVTKLTKEQRESEKGWKPENMSDEEALEQLLQAAEAMKQKIKAKNKTKEG